MTFSLRIPAIGLGMLAIGATVPISEAEAQRGGQYFDRGGSSMGALRSGGFQRNFGGWRPPLATGSIGRGPGIGYRPGVGYRPGGYGYRPAVGGYYGRPAYGGYYGRGIYGYRPAYRYPSYGYGYGGYPYRYRYGGYYPYRYGYGGYGYGYPYGYGYYNDGGAVAAGLIGGLALGAIASAATQPVYDNRAYYGCHYERLRVLDARNRVVVRRVRICP